MDKKKFNYRFADLNNSDELTKAMHGCNILLNVASLGFGSSENIINSCIKTGINRAVFVSTTAIFTKLNAGSKKIRLNAEKNIKSSNLKWTIIRPTMIFGTPRDRNIIRLISYLEKIPFIPVFGDGNFLQQPVFVKDVAWSIVEVIYNKKTFRSAYNIAGYKAITFNNLIDEVNKVLSISRYKIYIPLFLIENLLKIFQFFNIKFPIKLEQINRLNEHKNFSYLEASKAFNYQPTKLDDALRYEIDYLNNSRKKTNLK